jgi:hypothetical protein
MGAWSHLVGVYPERKTALKDLKDLYATKTAEELEELVAHYYREKKRLEREAGTMGNHYDACSELLVAIWGQNKLTGKKRNDIGTLTRNDSLFARVTDMSTFKEWATKNGIGNLVQETVNLSSLTSTVKEMITNGTPLPEGISIFTKSRIKPTTTIKPM